VPALAQESLLTTACNFISAALPASVLSHLMPYILTDPESANDSQPKNTRFLRIPKHFPEYIEEGGWVAPFLGASIVGKVRPISLSGALTATVQNQRLTRIHPFPFSAGVRRLERSVRDQQGPIQPACSYGSVSDVVDERREEPDASRSLLTSTGTGSSQPHHPGAIAFVRLGGSMMSCPSFIL
jgi:hypothetical protein